MKGRLRSEDEHRMSSAKNSQTKADWLDGKVVHSIKAKEKKYQGGKTAHRARNHADVERAVHAPTGSRAQKSAPAGCQTRMFQSGYRFSTGPPPRWLLGSLLTEGLARYVVPAGLSVAVLSGTRPDHQENEDATDRETTSAKGRARMKSSIPCCRNRGYWALNRYSLAETQR